MQVLNTWWVRILVTVGAAILAVITAMAFPFDGAFTAVVIYGIMTIALILVELKRPGGSLYSSGLGLTNSAPRHALLGVFLAAASLGVIGLVAFSLGGVFVDGTSMMGATGLVGLLAASAGEEIVFRGTIFEAIRERFGASTAVGLMAALFGLAHATNPGSSILAVVNVTLAGILFGVMAVRARSLWLPIFFHCSWNFGTRAYFGNVSGGDSGGLFFQLDTTAVSSDLLWLIDGPFGIEQGAVTAVVILALTMAVVGWVSGDRMVQTARIRRERVESRI